ncbi:MAG: tetratricopeptide repeat protein, partial [Gemmatimonadaceae bacterium]
KGKPQDVRAIGALLGVAEVLEGTVRKVGNRLRVAAQLTSTADGNLLWSERYDRTFDDVFALQDEIARTIVNTLRATSFADLSEPLPRRYTENVRAYGLYLRGRYAWNRRTQEGVSDGIRYFEQAIEEDPKYAPAYAGLADSYALHVDYRSVPVDEGFALAKEYARKAIALDETLAEAHASLAWSLFIYDWDWDGAEREYRRALALDPAYTSTHQWYAVLLTSRGAHAEALLESHTAMELDPESVSARRGLGWMYFYARRYDQARYHLDRAITMNPTAEESYRILGLTLLHLGQPDDAERVLRESLGLPGSAALAIATLGYVLGVVGKRVEAADLLTRLEAMASVGYVTPVAFAILHLGLGGFDRALDFAEQAYRERRGWMVFLNVNPILDPLRGEPRFQDLVRRVGLNITSEAARD